MNLLHWMKREKSGLATCTLEMAKYEEKQGHKVCIKEPGEDKILHGVDRNMEVDLIHSQLGVEAYKNKRPKIMWMHGEPLSSVGNGISMKAIVDLAPLMDCFICMREEELPIWNNIKKTHLVQKGIDLEVYRPLPGITEKLAGEPSILYIENWRGQRNPLYLCIAMEEVIKKYPKARLHLYNCSDQKMLDTFQALNKNNKWWRFLKSLMGAVNGGEEVNLLYNRCDMVVSCLYPLYARGIEAFGAGKAYVGAGYKVDNYPYQCDLDPHSMAEAICKCWEEYGKVDFRKWAMDHHDVNETVKQSVEIYQRYL